MKTFSNTWKRSTDKAKQRKYRFNAPLHVKKNMLSSNLSKDLREKYHKRSVPVVVGDKIKVARGSFKGKTGKITDVNTKKGKVFLDCVYVMKKSGAKAFTAVDASNLVVTELNLKDSLREKRLSGKDAIKTEKSVKTKTVNASPKEKKSPKSSKEE